MFILNIVLRGREQPLIMHFATDEGAQDACTKTQPWFQEASTDTGSTVRIEDGFGHTAYINRADVSVSFVTDVERDCEAQVRCQVIAQRAQADLQNKLRSDPGILLRQSPGSLARG